eukprot:scaffold82865_cov68-Phaeocystis_antarctica.AAC.4
MKTRCDRTVSVRNESKAFARRSSTHSDVAGTMSPFKKLCARQRVAVAYSTPMSAARARGWPAVRGLVKKNELLCSQDEAFSRNLDCTRYIRPRLAFVLASPPRRCGQRQAPRVGGASSDDGDPVPDRGYFRDSKLVRSYHGCGE